MGGPERRGKTRWLLLAISAVAGAFWAAGAMADTPAGYVGEETCLECHDEDVGAHFADTAHGRIELADWSAEAVTCENCHGPGAAHADEGEPELIQNPAKLAAREADAVCMNCHLGAEHAFWQGSEHDLADVSCTDCHELHQPWTEDRALVNREVNDTCLTCHNDKRKHLAQRSRHPLREGLMACTDCHDPHGSPTEGLLKEANLNDVCYQCHAEVRGPFLWEHAPVRENCLTCHDPHGSNQEALLAVAPPRLCQSCHLFGHHQTVAGEPTQVYNLNRSCVNCHHNIHGSNHPSGIIFMQ